MIDLFPAVGPYVGVQADHCKELADGRRFRLIVYAAYSALGLIGTECNGIAILDEDKLQVLCDEVACQLTGSFGASAEQWRVYAQLMTADDLAFVAFVNAHPRRRYDI